MEPGPCLMEPGPWATPGIWVDIKDPLDGGEDHYYIFYLECLLKREVGGGCVLYLASTGSWSLPNGACIEWLVPGPPLVFGWI